MIQFFQKIIILVLCIASTNTFSQENTEVKNPIKSMFTLGTGFYSFQGDIVEDESNYLSGNIAYNAGMRFSISDNVDLSFLITGPLDLVEEYSVVEMTNDYTKVTLKYKGKINKLRDKLIESKISVKIIDDIWRVTIN